MRGTPTYIALTGDDGVVSGWAVAGINRPDVHAAIPEVAPWGVGYIGYAHAPTGSQLHAYLVDLQNDTACPLRSASDLARSS